VSRHWRLDRNSNALDRLDPKTGEIALITMPNPRSRALRHPGQPEGHLDAVPVSAPTSSRPSIPRPWRSKSTPCRTRPRTRVASQKGSSRHFTSAGPPSGHAPQRNSLCRSHVNHARWPATMTLPGKEDRVPVHAAERINQRRGPEAEQQRIRSFAHRGEPAPRGLEQDAPDKSAAATRAAD
jgi:hypothetical protein